MIKAKPRSRNWIVIAVFVLVFLLRLIYITNSSAEVGNFWRQADTESIARNFVRYNFNIFYPQFNYDGPFPNYVQLELQITTFVIAILYKLFGFHYWLARLVPITFFMLSSWFVFLIAKKLYTQQKALISVVVYGIMPMSLFYSRAIMPEPALLCFFTGAFYFFIKWLDDEKLTTLILSGVFTCLAISQKLPAIFIGLAMLLMCFEKYSFKLFGKWQLWIFTFIALVPSIAYYLWAESIAEFNFVTGIGVKHILPKCLKAITTPQAITFYKTYLIKYFGLIPLILSGFGLFSTTRKAERPIFYWAFAMILEVILIVSVIRFKYYMIMLTPIIAILSGKLLGLLWTESRFTKAILLLLIVFIAYSSFLSVKNDFMILNWVEESAKIIDTYTAPYDLIVIGDNHPTVLSFSNRAGWRANIKYYSYIPLGPKGELAYFIQHGAKYFLVRNNYIVGDKSKEYVNYLKSNFEKIYIDDEYTIYKLQ